MTSIVNTKVVKYFRQKSTKFLKKILIRYYKVKLLGTTAHLLLYLYPIISKNIPKKIDLVAGLEMGGIPIATMISHYSKIPALFIRKKAKDYGTCKLAEGGEVKDKKILIIEDVVSTGGAIIDAVNELRKLGAIVDYVLCVIDRESGGKEKLMEHNLNLIGIFTKSELNVSIIEFSI